MIAAVLVVLMAIVTLFTVQNAAVVSISFLSWHFESPLALVVLCSLLIGVLVGMTVVWWSRMRRSSREKKATKQQRETIIDKSS
jgi:putative membrane protein